MNIKQRRKKQKGLWKRLNKFQRVEVRVFGIMLVAGFEQHWMLFDDDAQKLRDILNEFYPKEKP